MHADSFPALGSERSMLSRVLFDDCWANSVEGAIGSVPGP